MRNFEPHELFNCRPDFQEPNWVKFRSLELGGCKKHIHADGNISVDCGLSRSKSAFFTVYARDHEGLAEAIADAPSFYLGECILIELARLSGLPTEIVC